MDRRRYSAGGMLEKAAKIRNGKRSAENTTKHRTGVKAFTADLKGLQADQPPSALETPHLAHSISGHGESAQLDKVFSTSHREVKQAWRSRLVLGPNSHQWWTDDIDLDHIPINRGKGEAIAVEKRLSSTNSLDDDSFRK